jgi:hypothetical protein
MLCRYVNASLNFEKPRCSAEMGYGMMERDGRKVHAFKTGKVIVRRADGREMALSILQMVIRTVWPALLVRGGKALVESLSVTGGEGLIPAPPSDRSGIGQPELELKAALDAARSTKEWEHAQKGIDALTAICERLKQADSGKDITVNAGKPPALSKELAGELRNAEGSFLKFIAEAGSLGAAAPGLVLLALSLALERAFLNYASLGPEGRHVLCGMAEECLLSVLEGNSSKAKELRQRLLTGSLKAVADLGPLEAMLNLAELKLPKP